MTSYDVAINVDSFLFHSTVMEYNYIPQPSNISNWLAFLSDEKQLISMTINEHSDVVRTSLDDSELLKMGQSAIESLLAEDWNSPEDDIWDTI